MISRLNDRFLYLTLAEHERLPQDGARIVEFLEKRTRSRDLLTATAAQNAYADALAFRAYAYSAQMQQQMNAFAAQNQRQQDAYLQQQRLAHCSATSSSSLGPLFGCAWWP